ncbi:unnamed protein product [Chondrus crispus]|uniref:Uncharacterized protein n=1 Tax=Chondrus crispus TaxID=2769 RepID=R7QDK9_CHOCR|nr:unnamed protein product [Chondrus crispus]CDF36174.1 unnamed protein product [Chondrus crispus]|eukprot:XP_005715993.1 unnamed protein product [Chondrus crispus]
MLLTNPDRRYYDGFKVGYAELAPNLGSVTEGAVCGGILRKVTDAVASFSTQLLNYFHEQERSLPVIIESLYDPEDMYSASIERRIMRAIWKCGRKDESMVMLLRAVEDSPSCKQWTCRNLRRLERVAMPLWRRRYNNARGAVIAKFKQRKRSWERSAASTDMVFGSSLHRLNLGSATARSRMGPMPGIQSHLAEPRSYGSSSSTDNKFPTGHGT